MATFPDIKELQHYEVVFFDLDNTIYPYEPAHKEALSAALIQFANHYNLDPNRAKELYQSARKLINQRLYGQASSHSRLLYFKEMIGILKDVDDCSDALNFEKIYWQRFLSEMRIDAEALKLIKKLHKKNIQLGIITDLNTQIQLQKIKKLRIEQYFKHIITSEEVGVEKPNPVIFNFALNKFDVSANKAALIGDNINTDSGSEAIGIRCFLVQI